MLVYWLWSEGWDGPWSFTAAIMDELDCPLKPDLWSRGHDNSLGFFADAAVVLTRQARWL